jgi:hypothetical protein
MTSVAAAAGGNLYVADQPSDDTQVRLHALDAGGAVRWSVVLGRTSSAPLLDAAETVIVALRTEGYSSILRAYDSAGSLAWEYVVADTAIVSLAVGGDGTLFGCDDVQGRLHAFGGGG